MQATGKAYQPCLHARSSVRFSGCSRTEETFPLVRLFCSLSSLRGYLLEQLHQGLVALVQRTRPRLLIPSLATDAAVAASYAAPPCATFPRGQATPGLTRPGARLVRPHRQNHNPTHVFPLVDMCRVMIRGVPRAGGRRPCLPGRQQSWPS